MIHITLVTLIKILKKPIHYKIDKIKKTIEEWKRKLEEKEKIKFPYTPFMKKRGVTKTRIYTVNERFTTIKTWATLPILKNQQLYLKRICVINADFRYKKNLLIITLPSNGAVINNEVLTFLQKIYQNYNAFEKNETTILLITKESTVEMKAACLQTLIEKIKNIKQLPPIPIITDHYSVFEIYFNSQIQGIGKFKCEYYMLFVIDKYSFLRHASYINAKVIPSISSLLDITNKINKSFPVGKG